MGGIFHADTLYRVHDHLLVVILIIQIENLGLGLVDPKPPSPRNISPLAVRRSL
jgi:hypothetical protein